MNEDQLLLPGIPLSLDELEKCTTRELVYEALRVGAYDYSYGLQRGDTDDIIEKIIAIIESRITNAN